MSADVGNSGQRRGSASLGLFLVGVASFFLVFAKDIEATGLGGNDDPGPRLFPVAMAAVLLVGGVIELVRWRRGGAPKSVEAPWRTRASDWLAERGNRNVVFLAAALGVYLPAIAGLGFSISTCVFAVALAMRLGARPLVAVLAAVTMVVAVELLFVELFRVQLPEGALGLPPLVELARQIVSGRIGG